MATAYHHPVASPEAEEITIDELARLTGTTVRNVRAYQSRGLLPPPEVRARTGYYGPDHVARLRIIQAMQAEGFKLEAIQRLVSQPNGAAEQIFSFRRKLLNAFGDAAPEFASTAELEERFGGPLDPVVIRKAEKLDLIRSVGEDRWEIRNPTLVSAGERLAELGIPLSHAVAVAEQIDRHTRAIARSYARLFLTDVVGEETVSRSEEDWQRIGAALEQLRPIAAEAIRASFEQAMAELVEREVQRFLITPRRSKGRRRR